MSISPIAHFDSRFSEPEASAPAWTDVAALLEAAELYWITTVRADGRPHVTPLTGIWRENAFYFTTGPTEQKARNLCANTFVAVATGVNHWREGHDVVIEGVAERITEPATLTDLAAAYLTKYGDDWTFEPSEGGFGVGDQFSEVYRVHTSKALSFNKNPHGQTRYRF